MACARAEHPRKQQAVREKESQSQKERNREREEQRETYTDTQAERRDKTSSRAHNQPPAYKQLPIMAARAAATKVDWNAVTTKLGLSSNTLASLSAFRKRNTDARDKINALESQRQTVDFDFYRGLLKNQSIVDEIEKAHKSFKPSTYDVAGQIKAIEQFEAKAVENAQNTAKTIDTELSDLQATLQNIEQARPFDELTVDDVMKARPDIQKNVETMVKKGRWVIPGYVCLSLIMNEIILTITERQIRIYSHYVEDENTQYTNVVVFICAQLACLVLVEHTFTFVPIDYCGQQIAVIRRRAYG